MLRSFCFLVVLLASIGRAQSEKDTALAARTILDAYHAENPEPGDRKLHIICWKPLDRDYAAQYRERIQRIMLHIQSFYADEMKRNGLGERSFQLDSDEAGKLVIHRATGSANFADYSKPEGNRVKKDCWPVLKEAGLNPDRETVLIFTNLSDWDPDKNTFRHKSPYYAGGNHQRGTAWQLDSAELDTANIALKKPIIQDGEYGKISLGKHNSIFIGGIAHELGHALGLPHCKERSDEKEAFGTALMGSGNRTYFDQVRGEGKGSFITLAHALRLAAHPQFSGSMKGMNLPVKAEFSDLSVTPRDGQFSISGNVSCPIPVYAVIAYLDPEGGGDYDSKTHVVVPDTKGNFSVNCTALWPRKNGELRLVALVANGANSKWSGSYRQSKDGQVDVSVIQISLQLSGFLQALAEQDLVKAEQISSGFGDSKAGQISKAILAGKSKNRTTIAAREIRKDQKEFPLSQVTPGEAVVGWQSPAYDHVPRRDTLLISGGELFDTGIYAHAEARHVYDLAGAGWKNLSGKCGLPNQRGGSVVFIIKTDGKEVFRSEKTEPGKLRSFEIDLKDVKKLEMITTDAGDGKAVDWGFWLGVRLKR